MRQVPSKSVSGLQLRGRKRRFWASFGRAIMFFTVILLQLYNVYAASVSVTNTSTSVLEGATLYYVGSPSVLLVVADVNKEELNVLIDGTVVKTITSDGNYTLSVPASPFNLRVESNAGGTLLDQNYTPVKLSVSDIIVSVLTTEPSEQEPVRLKVTVTNDATPDTAELKVSVYDGNTVIKTETYTLELPADGSITKYFSFLPEHAGIYTVKAAVTEKGLTLAEQSTDVRVSVSRPDVTLDVSPTEVTLPADVVATVNIQNGPVEREYTVSLSVFGPDGSQVYSKTKTVTVSANGSRSVIFSVHLGEEYPAGPYTFLARVSFEAGGQMYSTDVQRSITAASDVPSLALSVRAPERVQVDGTFRFIAEFRHQSTKTYTYSFQCRVYDPDSIPVMSVPSVPAEVSLQPREVTSLDYQFTVPSDWKEGTYTLSCRAWIRGGEWTDEKQFAVEIPADFVTFFVRAYMKEGKVHASACYSTEALKPLDASLFFRYRTGEGVVYAEGPIRVKLGNSVECTESSWKPPEFIDPREISVEASLRWSGGEISRTADLGAARADITLQCDRDVVTPEDPRITCTLYANTQGTALFGVVPKGVDVPPVYDEGVKQILRAVQEVNVDRTAVVTLGLSGVKIQEAKVVAVFRDSEGLVTVSEYPIEIVPVAAEITSVKTFTDDYYQNDSQKPVVGEKDEFYQDVTVCSRSAEPITVKVVVDTPNDLVATALSNSATIELAPKQCVTKTFVFRTGRYVPAAPINITYSLYLLKGDRTYLLKSKTYDGPASARYYEVQDMKPIRVKKELVLLAILGIVVVIGLVYWWTRRKRKVEEVTAYEPQVQDQNAPR